MGNNRPLVAVIERDTRYPGGNPRLTVLRRMTLFEYARYKLFGHTPGKTNATSEDFIALSVGVTIDKEQYNALLGNQSQSNPILYAKGRIAMAVLPPMSALQPCQDEGYSV